MEYWTSPNAIFTRGDWDNTIYKKNDIKHSQIYQIYAIGNKLGSKDKSEPPSADSKEHPAVLIISEQWDSTLGVLVICKSEDLNGV